jgi:hypothetical protein
MKIFRINLAAVGNLFIAQINERRRTARRQDLF